ncbi:hypothetical protein OQA88_5374 [Cercophora sp. LCS_1]
MVPLAVDIDLLADTGRIAAEVDDSLGFVEGFVDTQAPVAGVEKRDMHPRCKMVLGLGSGAPTVEMERKCSPFVVAVGAVLELVEQLEAPRAGGPAHCRVLQVAEEEPRVAHSVGIGLLSEMVEGPAIAVESLHGQDMPVAQAVRTEEAPHSSEVTGHEVFGHGMEELLVFPAVSGAAVAGWQPRDGSRLVVAEAGVLVSVVALVVLPNAVLLGFGPDVPRFVVES